jgi:hypothetical protein
MYIVITSSWECNLQPYCGTPRFPRETPQRKALVIANEGLIHTLVARGGTKPG